MKPILAGLTLAYLSVALGLSPTSARADAMAAAMSMAGTGPCSVSPTNRACAADVRVDARDIVQDRREFYKDLTELMRDYRAGNVQGVQQLTKAIEHDLADLIADRADLTADLAALRAARSGH